MEAQASGSHSQVADSYLEFSNTIALYLALNHPRRIWLMEIPETFVYIVLILAAFIVIALFAL